MPPGLGQPWGQLPDSPPFHFPAVPSTSPCSPSGNRCPGNGGIPHPHSVVALKSPLKDLYLPGCHCEAGTLGLRTLALQSRLPGWPRVGEAGEQPTCRPIREGHTRFYTPHLYYVPVTQRSRWCGSCPCPWGGLWCQQRDQGCPDPPGHCQAKGEPALESRICCNFARYF